jgi:hypothetical protein
MAARIRHRIKSCEQFLNWLPKEHSCKICFTVYEEKSFKIKVYGRRRSDAGRTTDEKRSQKFTMSLCDRRANNNNNNITYNYYKLISIKNDRSDA